MSGVGITFNSQEGAGLVSKPLTNLPQKVVDEIAGKLGISPTAKQSLATGKIDVPDDIEIKITRLSDATGNTFCTIKKQQGGAQFALTYQNKTLIITP